MGDLPSLSGSAELRPPQDCSELDPSPASALLHDRLCSADLARLPAVPRTHRPRAHAADVRCQEHDVRGGPTSWPVPHGSSTWAGPYVYKGGGRADVERAEQELVLLRGMDPEQHQGLRVRHPPEGPQDGRRLRWQLDGHPGDVQARGRVLHGHVPTQGFPALVHGGGYG